MSEPQRVQLSKSKLDAAIDVVSLGVFATMMYFVLNPDDFDALQERLITAIGKVSHKLSVWQTKLSIRSLPETNDDD